MKRSPYGKLVAGATPPDKSVPELREAADHVHAEIINTVYSLADDDGNSAQSKPLTQQCAVLRPAHAQIFAYCREHAQIYGPTLQSLGIDRPHASNAVASTSTAPDATAIASGGDSELLDDLDDDEIDSYILSKEEASVKEELWTLRNGAIMEELEKRRAQKAENAAREAENPRKKRRVPKNLSGTTNNHNEAMLAVIQVCDRIQLRLLLR